MAVTETIAGSRILDHERWNDVCVVCAVALLAETVEVGLRCLLRLVLPSAQCMAEVHGVLVVAVPALRQHGRDTGEHRHEQTGGDER